jgi:hypothetical protein
MIVGTLSLACEGEGKNVIALGNGRGSDVVKRVGFFSWPRRLRGMAICTSLGSKQRIY